MEDTLCIFLQEQREFLKRQEATMTSFAEAISCLSTLPSQALPNPKGGLNAITLRSGTTLQERSPKETTLDEDIIEVEDEKEVQIVVEEEVTQVRERGSKEDMLKEAIPIPFSSLAKRTKKQLELDPKMVDNFKKVEVTILLFYAIRQVPKYSKLLKDLCMNKKMINELKTIPFGSLISALMGAISEKCGDPEPCLVSCTIGGVQFVDCMCDLGDCVSIMPLSIYNELNFPPLERSAECFVLADKCIIFVVSIAEDVLVSIKGLTFLIDFYILEMPPNDFGKPSSVLLGRPFLKTSQFKLDGFSSTYSFGINGRAISFNLDEAMKHPPEDHSIFRCDIIDEVVAKVHPGILDEMNLSKRASVGKLNDYDEDTFPPPMLPDNNVPSHELSVELKPLPPHLKYAFLDNNKKLRLIIARELTSDQE
ncbi:uncharacterized protein LOC107478796 [Arachis duranensis]|uniref:Uncharacterized protein LOC107478796 n=1 Tax=Arachis duranensis TaxID=130453 RepID=A0A6P4CP94_ARADU|nr:uncharacterized protein LOC107478796 [Arachis duranensis]